MRWSYEFLLASQDFLEDEAYSCNLLHQDSAYILELKSNNEIKLQKDISVLVQKNQGEILIQAEQRYNFSQELLNSFYQRSTFTEALSKILLGFISEDIIEYTKFDKKASKLEYLIKGDKNLKTVEIDCRKKKNLYQYLLVARAILTGYSLIEYVGKHLIIVTPNHNKRIVNSICCDCNEWKKYNSCLHKAIFDTYNTHRPLFHKYNELIEFYD